MSTNISPVIHRCRHCEPWSVSVDDASAKSAMRGHFRALTGLRHIQPRHPDGSPLISSKGGFVTGDALEQYASDNCLFAQRYRRHISSDKSLEGKHLVAGVQMSAYPGHRRDLRLCVFWINESGHSAFYANSSVWALDEELPDPSRPVIVWTTFLSAEFWPMTRYKENEALVKITNLTFNTDPGSDEALSLAREWLTECLSSHSPCPKPDRNYRPSRLIRIISGDGDGQHSLSLDCDTSGDPHRYAVLSYVSSDEQLLRLYSHNLANLSITINISDLSQTIKDAVTTAHKLGLEYLWTDALCILQDDEHDYRAHMADMDKICGNAAVTIVLSSEYPFPDAGFLSSRISPYEDTDLPTFQLDCSISGKDQGTIFLAPVLDLEITDLMDWRAMVWAQCLFSRRLLTYNPTITTWECAAVPDVMTPAFTDGFISRKKRNAIRDNEHDNWEAIMEGFSSRRLSEPAYSLDLLSTVARYYAHFRGKEGDELLAGHWRSGFPGSLLWSRIPGSTGPMTSPDPPIAPSWSRVRVNAFTVATSLPDDDIVEDLKILDCSIVPLHKDLPWGAVKEGLLTLRGCAVEATWSHARGDWATSPKRVVLSRSGEDKGAPNFPIALRNDSTPTEFIERSDSLGRLTEDLDIDIVLLLVANTRSFHGDPMLRGLALRQVAAGRYQRAGQFDVEGVVGRNRALRFFREAGVREFVVV